MGIRDYFKPKNTLTSQGGRGGENIKKDQINVMIDNEMEDEEDIVPSLKRKTSLGKSSKAIIIDDNDESDKEVQEFKSSLIGKRRASPIKKTPTNSKEKASPSKGNEMKLPLTENDKNINIENDKNDKKLLESSPIKVPTISSQVRMTQETVIASDPILSDQSPRKGLNYKQYLEKKRQHDSEIVFRDDLPKGEPDCLLNLSFLFTGDLRNMSREAAIDLIKQCGGRVVSAPSKKIDHVIVGIDPGPAKMEKIQALSLKTLSEEEFYKFVQSRTKQKKTTIPTMEKTVEMTRKKNINDQNDFSLDSMPLFKKNGPSFGATSTSMSTSLSSSKQRHLQSNANSKLWTTKYAPTTPDELVGNHGIYEKLIDWLRNWNSSNDNHAVLLSGPPGIGKTTMANMACKQEGFDCIIEMNASDARSKKTLQENVREMITNTPITFNIFSKEENGQSRQSSKKSVLIMDEVDGMSSGDRGGMQELIQLLKKTKIPIICICNDRSSPKVRSLANYCLDLRFRRPDARQIVPRLRQIMEKEGISMQANALEELIAGTQSDIRQIINTLSTFNLNSSFLRYEDGKALPKKDFDKGPFDAIHTLLGNDFSKSSLSDKIDQYFIDSSLIPLMIQENYVNSRASTMRRLSSKGGKTGNFVELMAAASDVISQADLIERVIRGGDQEWSLSPFHGFMSCVLPAYYCGGRLLGKIEFTSWLGHNSKYQKNMRQLTEIVHHAYFRKFASRQEFLSIHVNVICKTIIDHLRDGRVEEAIEFLDSYCLTKEDFDAILELSLDSNYNENTFGKLSVQVKSNFTRRYNQSTHLLPFSIGNESSSFGRGKAIPSVALYDLEGDNEMDGMGNNNSIDNDAQSQDDVEENSIENDKMIKKKTIPASRKASANTTAPAKRGKSVKK